MPEDKFNFRFDRAIKNINIIGSEYEKDSKANMKYWRKYFKDLGVKAPLEYLLKREEFIDIIQDLSFLEFGKFLGFLRLINLKKSQILHFINYRLKYKEQEGTLKAPFEKIDNVKNFLEFDFYFNIIQKKDLEKEVLQDFKFDTLLKQNLQIIFPELAFSEYKEIEEQLIQIFFSDYRDIFEASFQCTFDQIISCIALIDDYVYNYGKFLERKRKEISKKNKIDEESKFFNALSEIYIISISNLVEYYHNLNINKPLLNEAIIMTVIKKLSCNLGVQYSEYESIIDNSIFSKYLYIIDSQSKFFIYPAFLNSWRKLRRVFKEIIENAKKWNDFNIRFAKTFENLIGYLIHNIFGVKCYVNVWIDKKYQIDQLFIYKNYLFVVECTKREISLSSYRGGIPRLKRDIESIIKKNYSQLIKRKQFIDNNKLFHIYNSNRKNRVRLLSIRKSDFKNIIYLSISYDDFNFIISQKIFYDLFNLDISDKSIIFIDFKDLIILSKLFVNPVFIIHYLMSKNNFLKQLHKISLVYEEIDLIGLYIKGYLNQNKDFSIEPNIFSDHSRDIHNFLSIRSEDRHWIKHLVEPFYFKLSKLMDIIALIISFDNPNSLNFLISLLSCKKDVLESLNLFLIEAPDYLMKIDNAKPQRFFIQSPFFRETLIFILTRELPVTNIENYWSIIPNKLKGSSTWISFVSNYNYSFYHLIKGEFPSDIKYS